MNSTESNRAFKTYMESPNERRLMRRKDGLKGKYGLAKAVRVATTAPIMAAALVALLYFLRPGSFLNAAHAWLTVTFLSILPVMAYPVSYLVPALRKKGRDGQRSLAIVFSVIGYILGCALCFVFGGAQIEKLIFLTYTFSGALIALCSGAFHFKASGHACGVAGPIAALVCCLGPVWLLCGLLLAAVYWSSLKLRRHTLPQLLGGTVIPVASMVVSALILGII